METNESKLIVDFIDPFQISDPPNVPESDQNDSIATTTELPPERALFDDLKITGIPKVHKQVSAPSVRTVSLFDDSEEDFPLGPPTPPVPPLFGGPPRPPQSSTQDDDSDSDWSSDSGPVTQPTYTQRSVRISTATGDDKRRDIFSDLVAALQRRRVAINTATGAKLPTPMFMNNEDSEEDSVPPSPPTPPKVPPPPPSNLPKSYEIYFKLLRLGVPVKLIQEKMLLEGKNPEVLDDPLQAPYSDLFESSERTIN